eukprot:1180711-Prorocentrum_minimum.AAC.3
MEDNTLSAPPPGVSSVAESLATEQPSESVRISEGDIILKFETSDIVLWALILFFLLVCAQNDTQKTASGVRSLGFVIATPASCSSKVENFRNFA